MANKEFVEFQGDVHLLSPVGGGEHTLCGIAFDAHDSEDDPDLKFSPTTLKVVSCLECSAVIQECRGVRVYKGGQRCG